jgi:hypothetical protein
MEVLMKTLILPVALAVFTWAPVTAIAGTAAGGHPEMGNQDCLTCHQAATPKVVQEWLASAHGLALVQCGVCHGDEGDFQAAPGQNRCIGCHSSEVATVDSGRTCSSCHSAHNYNVHRQSDYAR